MPMSQKVPVGIKQLTNIAIVRLKTHGKRFEIACYKNKVLNWRDGTETDIDEVLQTDTIFSNVTSGTLAKEADIQKAFGTKDKVEVCKRILKSGDLQVSNEEREAHMEALFRDIVTICVERCVHPLTGRQHTSTTVDNALKSLGFSVKPDQTAKKQSLVAINLLCTEMADAFVRAKMRLRLSCPKELADEVRGQLAEIAAPDVESEGDAQSAEGGPQHFFVFTCMPSHYRELDKLATATYAGRDVSLQVLASRVHLEGTQVLGTATDERVKERAATAAPAAAACSTGAEASGEEKRGPKCSTCNARFRDPVEYRAHCKCPWHNFNLKRKVKSMDPVTEEEFAEMSLDAAEGFMGTD